MSKVGAGLLVLALVLAWGGAVEGRQKRGGGKRRGGSSEPIVVGGGDVAATEKTTRKEKVFDFTDFSIEGKLRTPQLLYFLGRARSELERASLRERSFIPEMVRSVDAEGL